MASYSLNNFTAPDTYLSPGQTALNSGSPQVLCGPATLGPLPLLDHINLNTVNSAIYYSLMLTNDLADPKFGAFQPETFTVPGFIVLQRKGLVGIRIRAAVQAGNLTALATQAQVTVECVDQA